MNKKVLLAISALAFGSLAYATGETTPTPPTHTCKNMGHMKGNGQMKVVVQNAIGKDICIAKPAAMNRQARQP